MTEQVGRYELLQEIGQGGFAIVYQAKDTELGRMVALKELRPMLLQDDAWVRRFIREAKTVAQLDHPHVVTIYDVYREKNRLFIVMHLIDGTSLDQHITKQVGLPWAETLDIFTKIAQGLDYAHEQGVLHRDLKPANILIDHHRGPMLTDFGLAKLTSQNSMSASVTGSVVGTPHYIAPEIWEGGQFTPQADIYAMGCILYEMLTGSRAFDGESPPSVMMAHFKPPSLPAIWPSGVPNDLSKVLIKALANQPTDRYNSAKEMVEMLTLLNQNEINISITPPPDTPSISNSMPPSISSSSAVPGATIVLPSQPDTITQPVSTPTLPQTPSSSQSSEELAMSHQQLQERVIQLEETLKQESSKNIQIVSPTSPIPTSQEIPDVEEKRKRRRPSCMWISIITVLLLLVLLVFGVSSICKTVERVISSTLNVELSEDSRKEFQVLLPSDFDEEYDEMDVELHFGPGDLIIEPAKESGVFLNGIAKYNVEDLAPVVKTDGNNVKIVHKQPLGLASYISMGIKNKWHIELDDVPLSLEVDTDHADTDINLGNLSIVDMDIQLGIGGLNLLFSEPNNILMDELTIDGGASEVTIQGLANSRAENIISKGGASDYSFDFSGELQNDIDVTLEGIISMISIIIPEGTPAQVIIKDTVTVTKTGDWQEIKKDKEYKQDGEGHTITIEVSIESGRIRLQN